MLREYICIIYPNEYGIRAQTEEREGEIRRICSVEGVACPKDRAYVEQEVTALQRNIAISVLVKGSTLPLVSVRLTNPIPWDRIFDATDGIGKCTLTTPMKAGTAVIPHLLGYDADVIVTKPVPESGCR